MIDYYSSGARVQDTYALLKSKIKVNSQKLKFAATAILMIFLSYQSHAQVSLYSFSQTSEAYAPISGNVLAIATATSGATTSLDSYIANIPDGSFPFPFNFNGVNYTGANMSSNGFITLGTTTPSTTLYTPISSSVAFGGVISAWAADINAVFHASPAVAGSMVWGVTGTAPNRVIVFEWRDFRPSYSTSTTNVYRMNYQVRLHETSNKVSIIYGIPQEFIIGSTSISSTRQIGLRGATNSDYNNRTNNTSTSFTASVAGASNSATQAFNTNLTPGMPSTGLTYTWTPPSCFTPSSLTSSNITPSTVNINWTVPAIGTPIVYEWELRTSGAPGSGATGLVQSGNVNHPVTSLTINSLNPLTAYSFYARTSCGVTDFSIWSSALNFTTSCLPFNSFPITDGMESMVTTGAGIFPSCWSFQTLAGTNPGTSTVNDANREPRTGTKYIYTPWNSTSWIYTPPIELIAGTSYDFSFYMRNKTVTNPIDFTMDVAYGSLANASAMINILQSGFIANNSQWTLFKYTIVPTSTGIHYFGIKSTSVTSTPWYLSFDDFKIESTPACFIPVGEGVANVTSNGADLFWSNPSSGSTPVTYEWEVRTSGAPGSGSTGLAATGTTNYPTTVATVSGLNSVTTHSFYVRTNCGGGTFSSWAGPINFLTSNPAVPNDICSGAISLVVNTDLSCTNKTPGTVAGATASSQTSGCFGTADDDVWFSFVATSTSHHISLLNVSGSTTDLYHSVYNGNCNIIGSPIVCSDPDNSLTSNLTIGNTYFIRVYTYTSTPGQTTTFNVCVGTPPPPPVNDECVNAISLVVNPTLNCTSITPGTIAWATGSIGSSGCFGTADDDVWYSFVATSSTHNISLMNVSGSTTDLYHVVYAGDCNSPGTPILCSDPNTSSVSGLTIGNTYYVRVYTYTSTSAQTTTFNICITTPPLPPSNDDCINAVSLVVNQDLNCSSVTPGTVLSATASTGSTGCFGTADDDVWYSFVATATTHYISLLNVSGSVTDMYHVVYSGNCGLLSVPIICSDPNTSTVTGLTIGNTYYIRVYTYTSTTGQNTTFNICVGTMPPAPVNDDCVNAINLIVNNDFNCGNVSSGTVVAATSSLGSTGCSGTADDDVWYTFTATATTHTISLINVTGSTTDLYHAVYSGSCGSLGTPILCSDPNNSTLNNLIVGNTYYVRVYTYTSTTNQTTNFQICIGTYPPPPANDDCGNATALTVNSNLNCSVVTPGTVASASASPEVTGCSGTADDDVWFSFVATSPVHYIQLLNVTGSTTDLYHAIYSGSCGSIGAPLICSDPNNSLVGGLVVGQIYLVRVYTYISTAGQTTTFNICISTPPLGPANDECSGAIALSVNPTQTCTSVTPGTVEFATPSAGATGCFGAADDDVWYSFIATSSVHTVNLTNISGSVTDMYHSVYNGNCNNLGTPLICSDPNNSTVSGLIPGNLYFVRVYTYTSTPFQNTTFNICVGTIPPPACVSAPTSPLNAAIGICPGSLQLSWPTVSGATGYDVYLGTSNNTILVSSNQVGTTFSANVIANQTYSWQIVPRNNGGPSIGCGNWTFNTTGPEISISSNVAGNIICDRLNPVTLTVSGADTYVWSPATGLNVSAGSSVVADPLSTTTYTVTGTTGNCSVSATTSVIVVTTEAPTTTGYSVCENGSIPAGEGLTASCASVSPTILSEDFNSSPVGWATEVLGVGGNQSVTAWTLRNSPHSPGSGWITSSTINSNDNSQFYMTDSDLGGSSQDYTLTLLKSPSFSTLGYSSVSLNYYNFYRWWNNNDTVQVQVSINGTSWTTIKTYAPTNSGSYSSFAYETISLDNYINQPSVSVRFRYRANWGYGWAIDNVVVSGSSAASTIKWYDAPTGGNLLYTGTTFNPIANGNLINSAPGPYTYYARCVTNGCESIGSPVTLVIKETPNPVISSTASMPLCEGQSTTLNTQYSSANGYTFSWNSGLSNLESVSTNLPGTYECTVTSPNGCTSSMVLYDVEVATIFADIAATTDILCSGGSTGTVTIDALGTLYDPSGDVTFGPYSYSIDGISFQASPTLTGLWADNHLLVVYDSISGCSINLNATITEPSPLLAGPVTINNNVSCSGLSNGSATASGTGGVGPYTYSWNTPVPKNTAENTTIPAGTWTVTIMDANGCTATATATITQPDPLIAVVDNFNNISCYGAGDGSAIITNTGGTAPFTGTGIFNNLAVGNHTFTVTDANGCSSSISVTITEPSLVSVNATSTNVSCNGAANGTITVNVPAGVVYTINGNAPAANYGPGTYNIVAMVPNGNGSGYCTATTTVYITQPGVLLVSSASQVDVSCFGGNNGSVIINATGGNAPYTGTGLKSGLSAGIQSFTVTDSKGCSSTVTITVTQPLVLSVSTNSANSTYWNANNGTAQAIVSGGTTPYQYLWSHGATSANVKGLAPATYTVIVTDFKGCTTSGSVTITEPQYTCNGTASHSKWGQGGWGGAPSGSNPATYMYANFTTAFPNGLRIGHPQGMTGGCNRSVLLTSPQAVTSFLPSTGTPRQLNTGHLTNPTATQYGNTFASQVVALTINVMFDAYDPNFSPVSTVAFGDMLVNINNSPYNNWSVNALLVEANKILACGGNKNQISAISDAIDKVNNQNSSTKCPAAPTVRTTENLTKPATGTLRLDAYPNPTSGNVTLEFEALETVSMELTIMDLSGRVMTKNIINGEEGINIYNLDLTLYAKGIYFIRVSNENVKETFKVIVQ